MFHCFTKRFTVLLYHCFAKHFISFVSQKFKLQNESKQAKRFVKRQPVSCDLLFHETEINRFVKNSSTSCFLLPGQQLLQMV